MFKTCEGKIYEGGWSNNKMHGRGREKFQSGECFLVFYKNGYRIDALASKKQERQVLGHGMPSSSSTHS